MKLTTRKLRQEVVPGFLGIRVVEGRCNVEGFEICLATPSLSLNPRIMKNDKADTRVLHPETLLQ